MTEKDLVAVQVANAAVDATLQKAGDRWMLTMTREFRHSIDRV